MAHKALLLSDCALWLQHIHSASSSRGPRPLSLPPPGQLKPAGSFLEKTQPCRAIKRQKLALKAKASGSGAAAESAAGSHPSSSERGAASASSSGVDVEGSHALPGPSKVKRKKASKHATPQMPAQEAGAEEVPKPELPSPEETRMAKAVLRRMHRLRHSAPNAQQLLKELGDPDPDDPACIEEIVGHMRLSQAIDPVGGIPQGRGGFSTDEHAWRPIPSLSSTSLRLVVKTNEIAGSSYLHVSHVDSHWRLLRSQQVEGPCLVILKNGTVAQSHVPEADYRLPYAMETHAVKMTTLQPEPAADSIWYGDPKGAIGIPVQKFLVSALPVIGLVAAYVAARFAKYLKGGFDDRQKLRRAEIDRNRELKKQAELDDLVLEPRRMAEAGEGLESIVSAMQRLGSPISEADVQAILDDVKDQERRRAELKSEGIATASDPQEEAKQRTERQRARQQAAAESEEASAMDKMQNFSRMRSVKVQPKMSRTDMEAQARMRAVGRQMKGVKLQYTADDRVFFDDVAGIGQAKEELKEVVDFFVAPGRFKRSGARIPKGVLLCGPPGTGKTLLARAVAGEAGVSFLAINASEFVEMFMGVGAARVRDLFGRAREIAPAIIFIDEIDAIGRTRGGSQGNNERDQTLNMLLTELDGFEEDTGVIIMGATNRKDVLDPALIRPGRFDRIILVGRPDYEGRIDILKVHLEKRPLADDINEESLGRLAFQTQQFVGASLANLVNIAALNAGGAGRDSICYADLEQALYQEMNGPESSAFSPERSRRLAVQEAATALVCTLMPAIEPVTLVSIQPRQNSPLGQTVVRTNEQRQYAELWTRRYLEEQLITVLAGRAAEELAYGLEEMTSINQGKLVLARRIVQKLVASAALNDELGPRTLAYDSGIKGRRKYLLVPETFTYATHYQADQLMERLLNQAYSEAKALLQRNQAALDLLINLLQERMTLEGDVVRAIVREHADEEDVRQRDINLLQPIL
ncbi:hypothetical protein WJX74_002762 [Apatococcus lobatus]|uniref:AAA+ ATPase domain-containing protein n=1 Tax=Apatococcus lobatus TaxID=904363 RepID=A0AAW1QJP8_9CHLO